MIYYIYKITLLKGSLSGKYYIGQHRTKDINDGYAGSGTILRNYYKAHGCIEGKTYTKEILRYCLSIAELNEVERELIADKYDSDPCCVNLIAGGRGKGFSAETRRKISEAIIGREISYEQRRRISHSLKGHPVPSETRALISRKIIEKCKDPEYRKKISEAQKHRKPISEETRSKYSEANKGRPCCWAGKKMPKYVTEKMSASHKGKVVINNGKELKRVNPSELEGYLSNGWILGMRDSDKLAMSERNKGKTIAEETKKKLSAINKGRKMSEEARAKIAANNRARASDPIIRKKISEAKKGKKHTPEHIAKVAAAKKGVPQSDEAKRKKSGAMKGKHWYYDKQLNKRV